MGMVGQRYALAALPPGKRLGTHCTGGWLVPRDCLDGYGKSRSSGIGFPDHPDRSGSLYRLRYPDPQRHLKYFSEFNVVSMAQVSFLPDTTVTVTLINTHGATKFGFIPL
jgi:hypothetical protein